MSAEIAKLNHDRIGEALGTVELFFRSRRGRAVLVLCCGLLAGCSQTMDSGSQNTPKEGMARAAISFERKGATGHEALLNPISAGDYGGQIPLDKVSTLLQLNGENIACSNEFLEVGDETVVGFNESGHLVCSVLAEEATKENAKDAVLTPNQKTVFKKLTGIGLE